MQSFGWVLSRAVNVPAIVYGLAYCVFAGTVQTYSYTFRGRDCCGYQRLQCSNVASLLPPIGGNLACRPAILIDYPVVMQPYAVSIGSCLSTHLH